MRRNSIERKWTVKKGPRRVNVRERNYKDCNTRFLATYLISIELKLHRTEGSELVQMAQKRI